MAKARMQHLTSKITLEMYCSAFQAQIVPTARTTSECDTICKPSE